MLRLEGHTHSSDTADPHHWITSVRRLEDGALY